MPKVTKLFPLAGLLLVLTILSLVSAENVTPSLDDDVLGLMLFKADIQDPKQKLKTWNEDEDTPCKWEGVKCNPRTGRVIELNLDGFSLSGRLGRGLLQLRFLHRVSLSKNNLTGTLNTALLKLENLKYLDLSNNGLSGFAEEGFSEQCGSQGALSLEGSEVPGKIPDSLSSCSSLVYLNLSFNHFSGSLPSWVWSLRGLRSLDLSGNSLEGEIPKEVGALSGLHVLKLSGNRLSGSIPDELGNCLLLKSLDLGENSLAGEIPEKMQKLVMINHLNLRHNALEGEIPKWIGEVTALETLDFSMNKFVGQIPDAIGNLESLKVLNLSGNGFAGSLPDSLRGCQNLVVLDLNRNSLAGDLPRWIFQLRMEQVSVSKHRKVAGSMKRPFAFPEVRSVQKLEVLDLSQNSFTGEIGPGIDVLRDLRVLNLSANHLVGPIPPLIGGLKDLTVVDLSHNQVNGSIPQEIAGAVSLKEIRLEMNSLVGKIPSSIEKCSSLEILTLSRNKLDGPIPAELAKLENLRDVDLSFNRLSGSLPKKLANLTKLHHLNVSYNQLDGELPAGGFFSTVTPAAVAGNPSLCGDAINVSCSSVLPKPIVLNPNSTDSAPAVISPDLGHRKTVFSISSLIAIAAAAVIITGVIAITVVNLRVRAGSTLAPPAPASSSGYDFSASPGTDANSGKLVSFTGELDFSKGAHAILNKDAELGRGGFGSVYRTVLRDGRSVAIKKLMVSSLVKSQEEFEREVKKLGKVRHPNLVRIEGYYWTPSLQLLIYEFVSGGSLFKHLHEGTAENFLSWNARFNIILGTAKSLAYLHQSNVIHYNIKSSNVLVDGSGEPKVGDYGLACLLPMLDRYILSSKIQSALGYMAPEFACKTVKITEKCDVYGFGVLVLEVVTGKKPVEYMDDDVLVLCDRVRGAVEEGKVEACVDGRLHGKFPVEEAVAVVKLGLICTSQVPSSRPDMREAVGILEMVRNRNSYSPDQVAQAR